MSDLIPCEHCEKPIARNAWKCPHCGGYPTSRARLQIVVILIAAVIAVALAVVFAFVLIKEPTPPAHAPVPAAVEVPANPAQPAR